MAVPLLVYLVARNNELSLVRVKGAVRQERKKGEGCTSPATLAKPKPNRAHPFGVFGRSKQRIIVGSREGRSPRRKKKGRRLYKPCYFGKAKTQSGTPKNRLEKGGFVLCVFYKSDKFKVSFTSRTSIFCFIASAT